MIRPFSNASASAAQPASFSTQTGTPMRSVSSARSGMSCSGMFTLARILPVANSMIDGMPIPIARVSGPTEPLTATAICSTSASWDAWSVDTIRGSESLPRSRIATAILVPPTSTPTN